MCERYSLCQTKEAVSNRFGVSVVEDLIPRYNVSPGQSMPVITMDCPEELSNFNWGLIPNWSLELKGTNTFFNANSELLFSKTLFKQSIRSRRCLILADGYYEWKKEGKLKIPYRVSLRFQEAFTFAGIWDNWDHPNGGTVSTFSIITKPSVGTIIEVHHQMPVILTSSSEKAWLDPKLNDNDISSLIHDSEASNIYFYKAHKIVNSSEYDLPECLHAAPKIYPGETYSLFES